MATKPLISDYLVPPGYYVREALDHYGMTQAELAERSGRPPQTISEIINAKKEVTEETAFELEAVLGTPAHVWLNLECAYRYGLEARRRSEKLTEQAAIAAEYPYSTLARLGLIPRTRNSEERVRHLLRFFGVAHLDLVNTSYAAAFQNDHNRKPSPFSLAAWLRIGERLAEQLPLPHYDKSALLASLPALRRTTRMAHDIVTAIREVLGPTGVAFVVAPRLPKTHTNGATFWHANRPVVLLSLRGVFEDALWFSLFHALGHVLLHERSQTFIEGLGAESQEEVDADRFAWYTLIPEASWRQFRAADRFDSESVRMFANEKEISPAVVVGRLIHEDKEFDRYPFLRGMRGKLAVTP